MTVFHPDQTETEGIHQIHNWAYADETARLAASGFVAGDVNKVALQEDNNTFWLLTAVTPTWVAISGAGTDFIDLVDTPSSYSGYGGYVVAVNVGETALEFIAAGGGNSHTILDATSYVTNVVSLTHNTSGYQAPGFGTGIAVYGTMNGAYDTPMGSMHWSWTGTTYGSRRSYIQINGISTYTELEVAVFVTANASGNNAGDIRAGGSVDLQTFRGNSNQVAGATYSGLFAGFSNRIISGAGSGVITGGSYNVISAGYNAGIFASYYSTVSSYHGVALGANQASVNKYGQVTRATGIFAAKGDAQASFFVGRRSVTHSDANWYQLYLNGTSERLTVASNQAMTFHCLIVGTTTGMGKTFGFIIDGVIENDGGTTTMLASNVSTIYDGDDTDFDARATADDTNDALLIEVSDSTSGGDTVRWVCTITTAEVSFP